MYLEFTRSGDRTAVDTPNSHRKRALQSLVMAELFEGKGRFLDEIINGVFLICEQTYWGSSAHFYMYGFDGQIANPVKAVPDIEDPIIDLVVGDMAADLSWIYYFFHEEFDKISPIISKRLKFEIQKKVLDPYYERYDYWWITGWGEGRVNNWNPWCNYNMLTCILLMEEDQEKKETGVYKTMESVDLFINSYPKDGGCDEGPSYWGIAAGKLFDYLDLLERNTNGKINIFNHELIKDMGRYIYRVYVSNGSYYINFADAPFRIRHEPTKIFRYGRSINDENLQEFGAFIMKKFNFGNNPETGRIGETMEALFNTNDWQKTIPREPLISEYYFPDLDIALGRDNAGTTDGFYFSAKGGSNGEGHNHNDVGSFMLYYNGEPVLVDVGVGTYTRETFSDKRYSIWTMQSNYHNLPVINGFGQNPGGNYRAVDSNINFTKKKVTYSTNIAQAYPTDSKVEKWIRTYELMRGSEFIINDEFTLKQNTGKTTFHFMTTLPCYIEKPGVIKFKGSNFELQMAYKPDLLASNVETIPISDERLIGAVGEEIFRVIFDWKDNDTTGDITFEITEVK